MDPVELIGLLALGFAAGMAGGCWGWAAESCSCRHWWCSPGCPRSAPATSLVAVVLVAVVGTWRRYGYGNVRLRDGLIIGVLSPLGVLAGVVLANALPHGTSSCRSPACSSWWPGNSRGRRDSR